MNKPSVMKHQFSQVPQVAIPRSTFKRDHTYKTTFDAGKLIPFYADEVLPGDSVNLNATLFGRLATPLAPIMDNIYLDTHYFFVPNRLIQDNFKKMMGEQKNPSDSTDYLVPQLVDNNNTGFAEGSLEDYLGLPIANQATGLSVSAYWRRAYGLIWNEFFRDQNLQDSVEVATDQGPDNLSSVDYQILPRGKRHDYFTSALPWPQKGPGVELPLAGEAPIYGNDNTGIRLKGIDSGAGGRLMRYDSVGLTTTSGFNNGEDVNLPTKASGIDSQIYTDLSQAEPVTINELRKAFALQKLAEKNARSGTRYTEIIKGHFNVTSPDARLQRPEFLGGGSSRINITPVAQTSASNLLARTPPQTSEASTPQGTLAGYGTFANSGDGFTKSFTEHGVIIGLVSARADLTYQNGVDRMFNRKTKYDFYWPTLAHLGEQEILNKEIYADGTTANDEGVFGYQERWSEYRYKNSKITSKFRSNASGSLDLWHLSQEFADTPTLSDEFIKEQPPIDRVIAVQSEPQFIMDSHIQCRTARPMPTYSVPGLGHNL